MLLQGWEELKSFLTDLGIDYNKTTAVLGL